MDKLPYVNPQRKLDGFNFWRNPRIFGPGWPNGADGDLNIGAGVVFTLLAGSIKDYRNITIASTGELRIIYLLESANGGNVPTFIGYSGNLNIPNGGKITSNYNVLPPNTSAINSYTYSQNAPDGSPLETATYTTYLTEGGSAGGSGAGSPGGSADIFGHGSGGGGLDAGGNVTSDSQWGTSGNGGQDSVNASIAPGRAAISDGFNAPGFMGEYASSAEVGEVTGGGGSGATRGRSGGCIALIGGPNSTTNVAGVCIEAKGQNGGTGGLGGDAENAIGAACGGGGGGGGAGGSGGKIYHRYPVGSSNLTAANCTVTAGAGGNGGPGGIALSGSPLIDGNPGAPGSDGNAGTLSIASY